jgi:acetyl-CoA synthetase
MDQLGFESYQALHQWSVQNVEEFWGSVVKSLGIRFKTGFSRVLETPETLESPAWFVDASMNIADSCFQAEGDATAVMEQDEHGRTRRFTYRDLDQMSSRVAGSLARRGPVEGRSWAILMPMTLESVAIYLGIIKAGGVVVSIAESFSSAEIEMRLSLANSCGIFVQDHSTRGGKTFPTYSKITCFNAPPAVVLTQEGCPLQRPEDLLWKDFLGQDLLPETCARLPDDFTNILFSSGTTGDPKAIPWTHTTPIKCASDGYFHHDLQPGDVIAWPTNLGWMMGPWLIYASLINRATLALYQGPPATRGFGEFIQNQGVTKLGVVPSLVKNWRISGCMQGLDWSAIKAFSSTGECSNSEDMLYLMSLAGYRPIIEYCGGTEIGGGYVTSTLLHPNVPSAFSTPALGLDFLVVDEEGRESDLGEAFIKIPSIGLSTSLLNKDHHQVYYTGCPKPQDGRLFRRHGDQIEKLPKGFYRVHGRADDTMNLSGIKVSSAEIERTLLRLEFIQEAAAVAVSPSEGGPSRLVIYAVPIRDCAKTEERMLVEAQEIISRDLNPQFKIHELIPVDSLPRTESNKVMRRELRSRYQDQGGLKETNVSSRRSLGR